MAATPTTSIGYQNFFSAQLTADITDTSTDIPLDNIPNSSEGFLVIEPDSEDNAEVIYYTSKTSLKVVCPSVADGRGQDDTSAVTHGQGSTVIMAPVAAYFEALLTLFTATPQGWTALAGTFTSPTYNGNRSYSLTTSTDQTAILSPGMRVRTTRTVAAPNQCTDLESGSSQYFNKTSPSGMTFTDDFVVSAWVKVESYTAVDQTIASRWNGTSGWKLSLDQNSGTVTLWGYNGGGGNYSVVRTYQSIPLGKWVHITAQLDMSAFTATTTTSYIMIDGVDVPCTVIRAGTNPTALIQAGNLEIGADNAGTHPFDGKLAQVAIFSAKVTQATIRGYISQGMAGSETSAISVYSFNNSINDLNANANNLTAQGSALATNADSPFGGAQDGTISTTLDYGVVTAITASTMTIQVPEGCTIPTSGGISAISYSTYKTPFGFVSDRGRWSVITRIKTSNQISFGGVNTWTSALATLTVPIGAWNVGYQGGVLLISSVSGTRSGWLQMSDTVPTNSIYDLSLFQSRIYAQGSTIALESVFKRVGTKLTAQTIYTPYFAIESSTGSESFGLWGSQEPFDMVAECAYI